MAWYVVLLMLCCFWNQLLLSEFLNLCLQKEKNIEGCYKLKSLQPVDMFPHTPHIECICLLELSEPCSWLQSILPRCKTFALSWGSGPKLDVRDSNAETTEAGRQCQSRFPIGSVEDILTACIFPCSVHSFCIAAVDVRVVFSFETTVNCVSILF